MGIVLGLLWVMLHALSAFMLWGATKALPAGQAFALPSNAVIIAGVLFWSVFTITLSFSVSQAVTALFSRGDMDLLFASPLNGKSILMVRSLALAASAALLPALFCLPIANVSPFVGMPRFLGIYLAVMAFALLSTSVAILLTMTLVKLLGVRRAKVTAQVVGALIGALAFIVSQAGNFFSPSTRKAMLEWFKERTQSGEALGPDSFAWWPARAFVGEILPQLGFALVAVALFWFTVNLTYRRFVSGTQESTGSTVKRSEKPVSIAADQFHRGLISTVLWKEWKLILRDPQIISQTLLQVLYLVPMLILGLTGKHASWLIIPGCVVLTAMLVGNLAWLTLAAEDAPDIVGTSPVPVSKMRYYKALAALIPVWLMLLPLALFWLFRDPAAAFVLVLCATGATMSSAMCHIWNPRKGDRRDIKTRHKQNMVTNLIESLSAFGWAGLAICLGGYYWWAFLALPVALSGPVYSWVAGAAARKSDVLA